MKCLYQFVIESYSKTLTDVFYGQCNDLSIHEVHYIDCKKK